ncbi:MAG: molybdopterin cofactor-binding domain-containing protein [Burkholderiaceae bacterium]
MNAQGRGRGAPPEGRSASRAGVSRRRFLAVAAGATLTVGFLPGCNLPVIPKRPAAELDDAIGWIRFGDGRYTLVLPRVEMGQNILTGLKQVACEELDVPWEQVDARLHASHTIARVRATVGSESIRDFAEPLAQACAALREAVARGQGQDQLQATARPRSELRAFRAGARRHVGRAPAMEQGGDIVRGRPLYVADVRREGMVFGRVLRAPASPELASSLLSMDEAAARAVDGFVAIVRDPLLAQMQSEGVGIVARTPGALDRIEQALAPRWQTEGGFDAAFVDGRIDIDRALAASAERAHQVHDDTLGLEGPWDIELRFDVPLAAHAPIEPRAAVADPGDGSGMDLFVGSQDVFYQRDVVGKRLGLDDDQLRVYGHRIGGAFGGKTICTVELEAAVLARAVQSPVKVQWTRAQEFRFGFHRPPSSHRVRVRLQQGRLRHWRHDFIGSHILFTNAAMPAWMQWFTDFIGDGGVARGSQLPYRVQARRTGFDLERLPVFTGPWRGLGAGPNGFVIESVMDECARLAGVDALQFRLAHVDDPRLAGVLRAVAQAAGWGAAPAAGAQQQEAGIRHGRGIACGIYKAMSYAAVVADVSVDTASGAVRVSRMWCAHDCGLVIHPDQVRAQCEGNMVWGVGMVLSDGLSVAASQVAASSFGESPLPRFDQVPAMEVVLVDNGEPSTGAGETAIVAAGAAVANAIRDAVGVRVQSLPWSPQLLPGRPSA